LLNKYICTKINIYALGRNQNSQLATQVAGYSHSIFKERLRKVMMPYARGGHIMTLESHETCARLWCSSHKIPVIMFRFYEQNILFGLYNSG
jgi:hypothetical protein